MTVRFDVEAVARESERLDGGGFYLRLVADHADPRHQDVLTAAFDAVYEALLHVPSLQGCYVFGGPPVPTPDGWLVCLTDCDDRASLDLFAELLVGDLQDNGWAGTIDVAPRDPRPFSSTARQVSVYAAGVALQLAPDVYRPENRLSWHAGPDLTDHAVSSAARFVTAQGPGDLFLTEGFVSFRVQEGEVRDLWTQALGRTPRTELMIKTEDGSMRCVVTDAYGHLVYLLARRNRTGLEMLSELMGAVEEHADVAEYALVRRTGHQCVGWDSLLHDHPPQVPHNQRTYWRSSNYVADIHVPDAYGMQYVGPNHLKRAHDLARWSHKQCGRLTRLSAPAAEAESWSDPAGVDEATLARARADFGDLILADKQPAS